MDLLRRAYNAATKSAPCIAVSPTSVHSAGDFCAECALEHSSMRDFKNHQVTCKMTTLVCTE